MSYDPHSPSDRADAAPDAYDGRDWNRALHGADTLPTDGREFWIVTEEGDVQWVSYSDQNYYYLREHVWARTDGEPGRWERDEIAGWTTDQEEAETAANELKEFFL